MKSLTTLTENNMGLLGVSRTLKSLKARTTDYLGLFGIVSRKLFDYLGEIQQPFSEVSDCACDVCLASPLDSKVRFCKRALC